MLQTGMPKDESKPAVKTVAYRIPVSLSTRLKLAAVEQGRTMSSIVIEAIEVAVELHEERAETAV